MSQTLRLAAAISLVVGLILVWSPTALFAWARSTVDASAGGLRIVGLLIAIYAVGYALAARDPFKFWPTVAVGLLGNVLLPLSLVWTASRGGLSWEVALLAVALTAVWWAPFGLILRGTYRAHRIVETPPVLPVDMALSLYRDDDGVDLLEASKHQPQFLVFLRHFGCTFCREAIGDLGEIRERLSSAGARLVLVHMASDAEACDRFDEHGLDQITAISDPDRLLYRAFALRRGSPSQLLGWSVWKRGWEAGVKQGHGIGWLRGDAAQMPGAFVVSDGHVVAQFVHETAADRPDYIDIAEAGVDNAEFQDELEQQGLGRGFQDRLRQLLTAEGAGHS